MDDRPFRVGEPKAPGEHILTVSNREQVTISGVNGVDSFDDQEIILETILGSLLLRGEDLHIKQLDLESGQFAVEGVIHSLAYSAPRKSGRGRGFLDRLLR